MAKKKPKIPTVKKLPKYPEKGDKYAKIVNNPKTGKRKVYFSATGKRGFGKWKIFKNEKA